MEAPSWSWGFGTAHGNRWGPENLSNYPPLEFTELHRDYPPLEIGPENLSNYPPPRIHGTSSTTPPSKSARKISPTTPPSNSRNFIDYPPPWKSARKISPTTTPPPSNSRNFIDYPPLEIGPENLSNYPPTRIHGTSSTTPPRKIEPPFSEPWLRPCAVSQGMLQLLQNHHSHSTDNL